MFLFDKIFVCFVSLRKIVLYDIHSLLFKKEQILIKFLNVTHSILNMFTKNKCELSKYNMWLNTYKLTEYK